MKYLMLVSNVLFCFCVIFSQAARSDQADEIAAGYKDLPLEITVHQNLNFSLKTKGFLRIDQEVIANGALTTVSMDARLQPNECFISPLGKSTGVLSANTKLYAKGGYAQRQTSGWDKEEKSLDFNDMVQVTAYSTIEKAKIGNINEASVILECLFPIAHFASRAELNSSKLKLDSLADGELNVKKMNQVLNPLISIR